jgi:hypothetical protein
MREGAVMKSLLDHADIEQLRTQAKELKRALARDDAEAKQRILAYHPKYAGRPAERVGSWQYTLRDAQVTVAREYGFDSWKDLVAAVEGETVVRWAGDGLSIIGRAFKEAMSLRQEHCGTDHVLLALLDPPKPTAASQVLQHLGITKEGVAADLERMSRRSRKLSTTSTPALQHVVGMAEGLAIGMGASDITDEHVLLALAYGDLSGQARLLTVDFDADDLVAALRAKRVPVPKVAPHLSERLVGPFGPWVYFPVEDFPAVAKELGGVHPPGTLLWGTNSSKWKKGYWYIHGDDEIDMETLVRRAVRDPSVVEVLTPEDGLRVEGGAAPRRYRARPEL